MQVDVVEVNGITRLIRIAEDSNQNKYVELRQEELQDLQHQLARVSYELRKRREKK